MAATHTSLVIVYALVQTKTRPTELVHGIGVLDVIADLTINDPGGVNESTQRQE
jgi:hypothetical protein